MKLTPENIRMIEAAITDYENGLGGRGIIIKYNLPDLTSWSGFTRCLQLLGIKFKRSRLSGLSPEDRKAFIEFLRLKKQQSDLASQSSEAAP